MPLLNVKMLSGRSLEQKQELSQALTRETARILGIGPEHIAVVIDEYPPEHWWIAGVPNAGKGLKK